MTQTRALVPVPDPLSDWDTETVMWCGMPVRRLDAIAIAGDMDGWSEIATIATLPAIFNAEPIDRLRAASQRSFQRTTSPAYAPTREF